MTHSCSLDDLDALLPMFGILFRIFASHKDLQRNLASLQRLEMFCYTLNQESAGTNRCVASIETSPFFAVVTIYMTSVVSKNTVAGNSYPSSQNYRSHFVSPEALQQVS